MNIYFKREKYKFLFYLQHFLRSHVVPQNKSQKVKRVTIMTLIFTGYEKTKPHTSRKIKIRKNCVSSLKLKDMPLKAICITEEFIYNFFEISSKGEQYNDNAFRQNRKTHRKVYSNKSPHRRQENKKPIKITERKNIKGHGLR